MKVWGWILLVFGSLSALGGLIGGSSVVGGLFFAVLGAYLLHRARQKKIEKQKKEDWANDKKGADEQ